MYTSCFIKITCFILILDSFRILWDHLSSVVQATVPASTHNRSLRPYAVDDPHCEMELIFQITQWAANPQYWPRLHWGYSVIEWYDTSHIVTFNTDCLQNASSITSYKPACPACTHNRSLRLYAVDNQPYGMWWMNHSVVNEPQKIRQKPDKIPA